MERVAERENVDAEFVRERVAGGQAVIPADRHHESLDPTIVGREFSTKVNANIGNSEETSDLAGELEKLVREGLAAYRIAAHSADVANGRAGARDWDDAISEVRYDLDWSERFDLALDPRTRTGVPRPDSARRQLRGRQVLLDVRRRLLPMRIDQDAREAGEMDALDGRTELEDSRAAEVNRPPSDTHDGGVPIDDGDDGSPANSDD